MKPGLSLIFCARNGVLAPKLIENIKETIGCSYELVLIDNSDNTYSINEAYQRGYEKSNYEYLAFLHDDIQFHTNNWGPSLIEHLSIDGAGICGIAGRETLTRIPVSWKVSLANIHIIQSDKNNKRRTVKHRPIGYNETRKPVIMLDGVVLCSHRSVLAKVPIDTTLEGFHAYDFDLCIRTSAAGFQNYVMYDIDIEHFSRGSLEKSYYKNLIKVFTKNTSLLPLSTENLLKDDLKKLEHKGIYRLARKLTVKGYDITQIKQYSNHFLDIIGETDKNKRRGFIQLIAIQYWLICIFYRPSLLVRKR